MRWRNHAFANANIMKKNPWLYFAGFAILPLLLAGLFILFSNIQALLRYEGSYFSPEYQEKYNSPGTVAEGLDRAIRNGDLALVKELTGIRGTPHLPSSNTNLRLTILLEVDDRGYYHYLFFDTRTYRRAVFYIKEIRERWVWVPQDSYFYWDSGRWLVVFTPLATIWWAAQTVTGLALLVYRAGARVRESLFKVKK
jgi:hypothetical protein